MADKVRQGRPEDLESWMDLVQAVREEFPGLESPEAIREHRETVRKFMGRGEALCLSEQGVVVGVLLYSSKRSMICCLAVHPECRGRGIGIKLLSAVLGQLDRTKDITVSTFRAEDTKGVAARRLYARFGFQPGELTTEFDYPNQVFRLEAEQRPNESLAGPA